MPETQEIQVSDRDAWILGAALVFLALTIALLVVNVVLVVRSADTSVRTSRQQAHYIVVNHLALCTLRQTYVDEASGAQVYLTKHPEGAPALHVSAAQIEQGIIKDRAHATALNGLNCGASR